MSTHAATESHQRPGPAWFQLFLGQAPVWYKGVIIAFLALNPLLLGLITWAAPAQRIATATLAWEAPHEVRIPAMGAPVTLLLDGVESAVPVLRWNDHGDGPARLTVRLPDGRPMPTAIALPMPGHDPLPLAVQESDPARTIGGGIVTARFVVGWMVMGQFIFTLAMALACYPLLAGGLLALEALCLGLCSGEGMYVEAAHNFPVIMLLIFVVAGVNFLKEWLTVVFTALLFSTRSKVALSLMFCVAGAVLSAFLDALTVTAVIIAVCKGFWDIYHEYRSRSGDGDEAELEAFRAFLRSLVMHAVIGTALGGVTTMVGEPQNLLIAKQMAATLPAVQAAGWGFGGFFAHMAIITLPTLVVGLLTCAACERFRILGYGQAMPERVRAALAERASAQREQRTPLVRARLRIQALCALLLVLGLAFHWAEVGILGLFLIVLLTAFTGVADEHRIGQAFTESLPFTALLVVFFAIVAMISEQDLFRPIIRLALAQDAQGQQVAFFCANAALSAISDNVFVATVFINEATAAFKSGAIPAEQYEKLAVAINTGTNIPSIATPNGQAALLFLLTSALAGPIRLGYVTMMKMALPYTVTMTLVSLLLVIFAL